MQSSAPASPRCSASPAIAWPALPEHGFFGPNSVTWKVDREIAVLLGSGSRALMLQVAHPKVAAAVADHSRYRSDPLGRLRDTLNAVFGFSFGNVATAQRILDHIHQLHTRVRGHTPEGDHYSALDPHLLLWVYATLVDSSALAYETFVGPLTPAERAAYYDEFRRTGPLWGITPRLIPETFDDLRDWMDGLIASGEVHVSPQGRYVGRFILNPRQWWAPPPITQVLKLVTIWLLPPPLRSGFGYTWGPRRELLMRGLAASSRTVVPRLPPFARDLPIARSAERRVAHVA
jgi:uncharacterized protein (DUF2236 family)